MHNPYMWTSPLTRQPAVIRRRQPGSSLGQRRGHHHFPWTPLRQKGCYYMDVSKNRGIDFTPKMDGENKGKPENEMDDLGVFPLFFGNTHMLIC